MLCTNRRTFLHVIAGLSLSSFAGADEPILESKDQGLPNTLSREEFFKMFGDKQPFYGEIVLLRDGFDRNIPTGRHTLQKPACVVRGISALRILARPDWASSTTIN